MIDATDLATLATEINAEHQAAETAINESLQHARRCGELLIEAKAQCEHGEWGGWVEANFSGSYRTARDYMRIASKWPELERQNGEGSPVSGVFDALQALAEPREPEPDSPAGADDTGPAAPTDPLDEIGALSDGEVIIGHAGQWTAIVEPSQRPGYYHVAVLFPSHSSPSGVAGSGTDRPVPADAVPFYILRPQPEGKFPAALADWNRIEATGRPWWNRWLYPSEEDYIATVQGAA